MSQYTCHVSVFLHYIPVNPDNTFWRINLLTSASNLSMTELVASPRADCSLVDPNEIIAPMSESERPTPSPRPISPVRTRTPASQAEEKMLCDRCGAEMYRMH